MKSRGWMRIALGSALVVAAAAILHFGGPTVTAQAGNTYPVFEVDTAWPPKLPYNWMVGHVPSIAVDARDHVFVLSRPDTLSPEDRARSAPPVLELDETGKFVNAWGGRGIPGFDWPDSEHGIAIDYKGNVWIGGSAPVAPSLFKRNDDMILKFTHEGKLIFQIGGRDKSPTSQNPPVIGGNKDIHSFHQPTDVFVYQKTNEAFISDGYGNRRVIVYDADKGDQGGFKRLWGAFGKEPVDVLPKTQAQANALAGYGPGGAGTAPAPAPAAPAAGGGRGAAPKLDTEGEGSPVFDSPVHGVKVSNDGIVYVADRSNRRVQVFDLQGKYITQVFLNRKGPAGGSAAGVAFSPDAAQRFLYVADYGNSHVAVFDRKALKELYQFGRRSAKPGDFQGIHHFAVDSKGNMYTGEVAPGARMQRFIYKGTSATLPPNAVPQAELSATTSTQYNLGQIEAGD
jgi:hypothetical protein